MSEPTPPPRGVIDDAWEQELTAGQEAVGEHGDLEADLAVLHLLRHARAPEVLGDEALEEVLEQLKEASAPASTAWWRRGLVRWVAVPLSAPIELWERSSTRRVKKMRCLRQLVCWSIHIFFFFIYFNSSNLNW